MLYKDLEAGNVVAVFMGDQNAGKFLAADPQFLQSLFNPFAGNASIDQDMRPIGAGINTVSVASGGYTSESHKDVNISFIRR